MQCPYIYGYFKEPPYPPLPPPFHPHPHHLFYVLVALGISSAELWKKNVSGQGQVESHESQLSTSEFA